MVPLGRSGTVENVGVWMVNGEGWVRRVMGGVGWMEEMCSNEVKVGKKNGDNHCCFHFIFQLYSCIKKRNH